ncbi:MAG: hypothetical protein ACOYZ6_03665 [Chloroflexota bacterium]
MTSYAICPSCNEENPGSLLMCRKCQASLIGVPRIHKEEPETATDSPVSTDASIGTASPAAAVNYSHAAMLAEIRSWAFWSLGLGALHLITLGFLSTPWGILLVIVGLGSFLFQSASMFIIYAVTLAWAGLSNVLSLEAGWIFFGLYQFYLAFRVFQRFRLFHNMETEASGLTIDSAPKERADQFFPWLGSVFGCSSIAGFVLLVLAVIFIAVGSNGTATPPDYFGFIEGLIVNFGVLGASIGLASLLSKYKLKALVWIGLIAGVLTVVLEYALIYLL